MSKATLTLKQLCFTGPEMEDACLSFHMGLNIIYGASEAGKSFILDALDFMLGGGTPLRDISERVGYDRIWLAIMRNDKTVFTLTRSTEGGDFNLYEGTHRSIPAEVKAVTLKSKHDANKTDNISAYVLEQIGLANKKLKKRADGTTINFTLPALRHMCIISETNIQKVGSPILSGQFTSATAEMSAFKLLLTGVDDSALIKSTANSPANQSREAKLEIIDELITSYEERFKELSDEDVEGVELAEQLQKIEETIAKEQTQLSFSEAQFKELSNQRTTLRTTLERSAERREEIREMLQRFTLLKEHYSSDISRLEGIREAGSLVAALAPGNCPLCGADADGSHPDTNCDANLDVVITAANAEIAKILQLQNELQQTIQKLEIEAGSFERLIPRTQKELSALEVQISQVAPSVLEGRTSYQALVDKRASVRAVVAVWDEIQDLNERKVALEGVAPAQVPETVAGTELSASVSDSFSQVLEATLKAWHFPNAERVYFDQQKKDFVIAGKLRGSRGKGMRAITHAAFTVSLLEYCKREKRSHLGFVVMDSPLLAYREPDAADDGVSETGLNEEFFSYLSKWTDRQAIIIENVDPPEQFTAEQYSTYFSGNPNVGRAGFFPLSKKKQD